MNGSGKIVNKNKRLLIVDGYNVLRSGSRYKPIDFPDYTHDVFNQARERLINDVIAFASEAQDPIIVFDAGENPLATHGSCTQIGSVCIMFSQHGQTADALIEKLAFDAREKDIPTLVISSDGGIQDAVFGGCVERMSAEGFCLEMDARDRFVQEEATMATPSKSTVASRIPNDVVEKLKALRDGN